MPSNKSLPSQARLDALFRYDPATGKLFHKTRAVSDFDGTSDPRGAQWSANAFNARYADQEAFTFADRRGYRHGKIDGTNYQAHRVIWKLAHGADPDTIDHRNGDQGDNRLENLRDCSVAENSRNYAKPLGSSSTYRGVTWVKRDKAWAARISDGTNGKKSLGYHTSEVDAARAYDRAARELHGEFAVLNFPSEVS